jgi:hypothetical protein
MIQLVRQASRTINNHLDLVINALHFVTHFVADFLYFVTHALYFTVYYFNFVSDVVCDPQYLRMRHPSLLLRQSVQLLESVLQISHSGQFPQEFFCARFSHVRMQLIGSSLADPRLSSFVAIPKILSTSAIMSVIMLVIAVVGATSVYVSSRAKNHPMRSKSSPRTSLLAETPWAACKTIDVRMIRRKVTEDTHRNEDTNACKYHICR